MKFAIIETGGKQYKVAEGDELRVEKLDGDFAEGDTVTFDKVLLTSDGKKTDIGSPYLDGTQVSAEFIEEGRGKKLHVIRFRAKSRHFKKHGHRQAYTKVKITNVS